MLIFASWCVQKISAFVRQSITYTTFDSNNYVSTSDKQKNKRILHETKQLCTIVALIQNKWLNILIFHLFNNSSIRFTCHIINMCMNNNSAHIKASSERLQSRKYSTNIRNCLIPRIFSVDETYTFPLSPWNARKRLRIYNDDEKNVISIDRTHFHFFFSLSYNYRYCWLNLNQV